MARLLQIAHDHLSPAGAVADQFVQRGYDITELLVVPEERFADPGVDVVFPDPTCYDAVMLLGAPWSAYAADVACWVEPEIEMLRSADRAGVPVLGICFGGQLLAAAHGGGVDASPVPESGWHLVYSDDPVLDGAWFQWHYDRWVMPPGAVVAGLFALAGLDPITSLVPSMLGFGTLSVIVLQVLAALSIVVYFRRAGDPRWWSTFFAPGIGFLGLLAITLLAIVNFDIVAGSDALVIRLMPLLLILALIGGIGYGAYLMKAKPAVYDALATDLEKFNE